jgi:hypothetical protein
VGDVVGDASVGFPLLVTVVEGFDPPPDDGLVTIC